MDNDSIRPPNPLLIPDLFNCILECLLTSLPQHLSKEERHTLTVLARTCRAFSEPSLNYLWRRLGSLLPLIRCFSDVVDEGRAKTPPSPLEWRVIHQYSHRIQELTLGNESLSLYFLQHSGLVLPNLRVFRWKCFPRGLISIPEVEFSFDVAFLWPLLTPHISALELRLRSPDDPKYPLFLQHYPILCPNLKSIKLDLLFWADAVTPSHVRQINSQALYRGIRSNAGWQHVEICGGIPIDDALLKYLGMSPILRTVSLTLDPQASWSDTCFGPEDTPFCNATDLVLKPPHSFDVAKRLLRPRDQAFRSFEVDFPALTVATEVSALTTALASPHRIRSLQSVVIMHVRTSDVVSTRVVTPTPERLCSEMFRPLTALTHLRRLEILLKHQVSLNDEEFADLVRSWPRLEVLKIAYNGYGVSELESLTLKGLLSLLVSCLELRKISLVLDARKVPVGVYPHSNFCSPLITSPIAFLNAPIEHPNLVAEFLQKHLPSMPGVHARSWSMHMGKMKAFNLELKRWSQVNQRIGNPNFNLRTVVKLEDDFY